MQQQAHRGQGGHQPGAHRRGGKLRQGDVPPDRQQRQQPGEAPEVVLPAGENPVAKGGQQADVDARDREDVHQPRVLQHLRKVPVDLLPLAEQHPLHHPQHRGVIEAVRRRQHPPEDGLMLLCAAQGSFLCKGIEEDVSAAVVIFHFGFQPGGQLHPVALVGRRFLKAIDPALEAGRQRALPHRAHQVSAAVVHDVARQHLYLQGSLPAIRRAHRRQHPLQRAEHHQHRRAGREQHQHNPAAPDLPFAAKLRRQSSRQRRQQQHPQTEDALPGRLLRQHPPLVQREEEGRCPQKGGGGKAGGALHFPPGGSRFCHSEPFHLAIPP